MERMQRDTELDRILAALAREVTAHESELLLEIRDAAASPGSAGSCVSHYFTLLEAMPDKPAALAALGSLRLWLECHLNIEVLDDERRIPLESLPLRLTGAGDLASFCHSAMDHLRNDRCHATMRLRLQIGFSRSEAPST